jgi:hypothetical protein
VGLLPDVADGGDFVIVDVGLTDSLAAAGVQNFVGELGPARFFEFGHGYGVGLAGPAVGKRARSGPADPLVEEFLLRGKKKAAPRKAGRPKLGTRKLTIC